VRSGRTRTLPPICTQSLVCRRPAGAAPEWVIWVVARRVGHRGPGSLTGRVRVVVLAVAARLELGPLRCGPAGAERVSPGARPVPAPAGRQPPSPREGYQHGAVPPLRANSSMSPPAADEAMPMVKYRLTSAYPNAATAAPDAAAVSNRRRRARTAQAQRQFARHAPVLTPGPWIAQRPEAPGGGSSSAWSPGRMRISGYWVVEHLSETAKSGL
jgi:hypothetical protein